MADIKRVSSKKVHEALPLLRQLLASLPCEAVADGEPLTETPFGTVCALPDSGNHYLRVHLPYSPDTTYLDKREIRDQADTISKMFEPHQVYVELRYDGTQFTIDEKLYRQVFRNHPSAHPDDRLYHLLDQAGYADVTRDLKQEGLEEAVRRFGAGGMNR